MPGSLAQTKPRVAFQTIAEVKLFEDDNTQISNTEHVSNKHLKKPKIDKPVKHTHKSLKIYCANVTSLSLHAIDYLFTKCSNHHIWALLETRLLAPNIDQHKAKFKQRSRQFVATPATPTAAGGMAHGGELIAPMHHLNISQIDASVFKFIESKTGSPLRICAVYVRLKHLTFVFANAYFWDKVGPKHEDNHTIFMQIYLLQSIIGLHLFVYADFNCTPEDLIESGWPDKLHMQVLAPQGPTTKSSNIMIDFALVHFDLFALFSAFGIDNMVPWGPHYGLDISVAQDPMLITGSVMCSPRDLPMGDFKIAWETFNQYQQYKTYIAAQRFAKKKIAKTKM